MIARWQIEARFGQKQNVVESLKRWFDEVGSQIGWTPDKFRILTGSVGALESTVTSEIEITDLSELGDSWAKLGEIKNHSNWSKDLEPYIGSRHKVSEVLTRKRDLSLNMIRRLHRGLRIPLENLIGD